MGDRTGLLSVGEVARRAGLTTKALRHYDRLGVLVPTVVGDDGYRWYAGEQVATARVIARLRALDVPLDVVRVVLGGAAEADIRRHLLTHRNALQARDDRLRRALHSLDHLIADDTGVSMALNDTETTTATATDERALASQLYNDTWRLLEKETRTPAEDDRMIHSAHASRFHWDNVGDDQNRAIGEWQCSRVYSTLGRGEPALFHARRCLSYAAGDTRDRALALAEALPDPEDRRIVLNDVDTLPIP
jgi:DNA-binding transcriptional MerR regulator